MSTHCLHCAHEIVLASDGRLPPWCSHCGGDLKAVVPAPPPVPAAAGSISAYPGDRSAPASPSLAKQTIAVPELVSLPDDQAWDGRQCNACGTPVEIPDWWESAIAACPECGQCLQAPPPWTPTVPATLVGCLSSTREKTKYPGWVGIMMGSFAIAAAWSFPGINLFAQWAATLLGGALLVEGLGRVRAETLKQQRWRRAILVDLTQEMPEEASELENLQGVYQTHNSWGDSLAIVLFGLAIAFGGLFGLSWLGAGIISVKLLAAAVMAPLTAIYMLYRALRNLYDRRRMLVFANGLMYLQGSRVYVYPWDRVKEVKQEVINDAIDEKAVEIHVSNGRPPLRFTCAHFRNLDQFAARVQQGFAFQKLRSAP